MLEIIALPFMKRAFLEASLIGYLASYFGVFVVQRKMSFLGNGLAHSAFGGVALGLLLQIEPLYIAIPFTLIVSLAITWVHLNTKLSLDTAIGIFFSGSVALGVIFLSLKKEYTADVFNYLFGSILSVTESDIIITLVIVFISFFTWPLWGSWAYASFDRELSVSDRAPVIAHDYLLAIILAFIVTISVKIIGIVLIASFLVIPAATARLLCTRFSSMTVTSIILGVLGAWGGLLISYIISLPSGASIILVQSFFFIIAILISFFKKRRNTKGI